MQDKATDHDHPWAVDKNGLACPLLSLVKHEEAR